MCLALTGCGGLLYRSTHLRSFDQRLAHAYGMHEVILKTVPTAVIVGYITPADGDAVIRMANEARDVLDLAHTADLEGHGVAADESLRLGWGLLWSLDDFLKSQRPSSFLKAYEEWQPK